MSICVFELSRVESARIVHFSGFLSMLSESFMRILRIRRTIPFALLVSL